jgi:PleD family two-component response regulator
VKKSILLVCTDDLRTQLSLRILRAAELRVERAERPEAVENLLRSNPEIGVVLCDWKLPLAATSEWIERWRNSERGKAPFYIVVSDRLPTSMETSGIFQRGISDLWMRPLPDFLLVPRLRIWLELAQRETAETAVAQAHQPPAQTPNLSSSSSNSSEDRIDPDTQLLGRELLLELAEGMFAGARRLNLCVGCLTLAIGNMHEVIEQLGPGGRLVAIQFLTSELLRIKRREDILGRWDESVFVVVSFFPRGESVEAFGRRMIEALQKSRFPHSDKTGPLRFTVAGAWGPSRDYPLAKETIESLVRHTHTVA